MHWARRTVLWMLVAGGCSGSAPVPPARTAGKRLILTTFQPLYSFAAWVAEGSPVYDVVNLAPPNLGPHEFVIDDPARVDRVRELLGRADAVVTLGALPVAPAFSRVYPWCRSQNIRAVEIDPSVTREGSAPRLALIPNPEDSARALPAAAPDGVPTPNPHLWLSLSHAGRMVEAIAQDLALLDPGHADLYRRNADRAAGALRRLKAEFEKRLVDAPPVAALTEGFPYLCADFGIDVADYLLEPKSSEEITSRLRAARVTVVLAEEPPPAAVRNAVASAGAQVVVLTTLEEGWNGRMEPEGYLEGMRSNLSRLVEAFRAR